MSAMIPDPDGDGYLIGSASEHTMGVQVGVTVLSNVHPAERCEGRRGDRALMERICPARGVGHPDPDDLAWRVSQGYGGGVHGCCGCCVMQEFAA